MIIVKNQIEDCAHFLKANQADIATMRYEHSKKSEQLEDLLDKSSPCLEEEIQRLSKVVEDNIACGKETGYERSQLLQCSNQYLHEIEKPREILTNFDSVFKHFDEIFNLEINPSNSTKIERELRGITENLDFIENILFVDRNHSLRKEKSSFIYQTFYDLNNLLMEMSDRNSLKGLDRLVRPRKEILDALAQFNPSRFARSQIISPDQQSYGFIEAAFLSYLGLNQRSQMITGKKFQSLALTKELSMNFESMQRNVFSRVAEALDKKDYHGLKQEFNLEESEKEIKKVISSLKAFEDFVSTELDKSSETQDFVGLKESIEKILVLDTIRTLNRVKARGFKAHLDIFSRYLKSRQATYPVEPHFRSEVALMHDFNANRPEYKLYGELYNAAMSLDHENPVELRKQVLDSFTEAQISMKNGKFVSWDADQQKESKDQALENGFRYYQEQIFDLINEDLGMRAQDALDQAFVRQNKRSFNRLMKQIIRASVNNGVSKRALLEFSYIAPRLFLEYKEMKSINQVTWLQQLRQKISKWGF